VMRAKNEEDDMGFTDMFPCVPNSEDDFLYVVNPMNTSPVTWYDTSIISDSVGPRCKWLCVWCKQVKSPCHVTKLCLGV
jgi:hypothetical protein